MFFHAPILGDRLPPGTLCMTYDDGPGHTEAHGCPGPRTAELGAYLQQQGVPATFFVVGKFAASFTKILDHLSSLGHVVANHTYDHPSLPAFVEKGGDVIGQIDRTTGLIRSRTGDSTTYFRPPYGDWRLQHQRFSNVAQVLNRSELAKTHVGPVGWDIDAGDIGFWRDGHTVRDCASAYLDAIEKIGRGIVLMHDSTADIDELRGKNRAYELTRLLIPELRSKGYQFVKLDSIPQVRSARLVSFQAALTAPDGRLFSSPPSGSDVRLIPRRDADPKSLWGIVEQGADRWALRAWNGRFLSITRAGNVVVNGVSSEGCEVFSVVHRSGGRIALRTADGIGMAPDPGGDGRLVAQSSSADERFDLAVERY